MFLVYYHAYRLSLLRCMLLQLWILFSFIISCTLSTIQVSTHSVISSHDADLGPQLQDNVVNPVFLTYIAQNFKELDNTQQNLRKFSPL